MHPLAPDGLLKMSHLALFIQKDVFTHRDLVQDLIIITFADR